jgi:hypothetical protein
MTTTNTSGKVAYMYDQETDTWYALSGAVNTNAAYTWTATQTFGTSVNFQSALNAKAGVNNFLSTAERDTVISSPTNGTVCFVRDLQQLQYYWNGSWRWFDDSTQLSAKTENYQLTLDDVGKTVTISSTSDTTVTIPLNSVVPFAIGQRFDFIRLDTGNVTFVAGDVAVGLQSKNSNKKIAARYSGATLIKIDTNNWILIGDLTA